MVDAVSDVGSLLCVVVQGGLNFSPDQVALPVSFAGLALVIFALLFYQRIQRRVGCLACAKIGLTVAIFVVLLIPTPSLLVPRCAPAPDCEKDCMS
jgi:hypothetical protein